MVRTRRHAAGPGRAGRLGAGHRGAQERAARPGEHEGQHRAGAGAGRPVAGRGGADHPDISVGTSVGINVGAGRGVGAWRAGPAAAPGGRGRGADRPGVAARIHPGRGPAGRPADHDCRRRALGRRTARTHGPGHVAGAESERPGPAHARPAALGPRRPGCCPALHADLHAGGAGLRLRRAGAVRRVRLLQRGTAHLAGTGAAQCGAAGGAPAGRADGRGQQQRRGRPHGAAPAAAGTGRALRDRLGPGHGGAPGPVRCRIRRGDGAGHLHRAVLRLRVAHGRGAAAERTGAPGGPGRAAARAGATGRHDRRGRGCHRDGGRGPARHPVQRRCRGDVRPPGGRGAGRPARPAAAGAFHGRPCRAVAHLRRQRRAQPAHAQPGRRGGGEPRGRGVSGRGIDLVHRGPGRTQLHRHPARRHAAAARAAGPGAQRGTDPNDAAGPARAHRRAGPPGHDPDGQPGLVRLRRRQRRGRCGGHGQRHQLPGRVPPGQRRRGG
ncbi:MAG: hypothetical protein RLZZ584_3770 [Pseudomonadota bacterium]